MKVIIKGDAKEIAGLAAEIQNRRPQETGSKIDPLELLLVGTKLRKPGCLFIDTVRMNQDAEERTGDPRVAEGSCANMTSTEKERIEWIRPYYTRMQDSDSKILQQMRENIDPIIAALDAEQR